MRFDLELIENLPFNLFAQMVVQQHLTGREPGSPESDDVLDGEHSEGCDQIQLLEELELALEGDSSQGGGILDHQWPKKWHH